MTITIRKFRKKDAEQFNKIICQCADTSDMKREMKEFIKSKNTPEQIVKASNEFILILAFIDGKLVGGGGIDKDRIRKMFVHPNHHRKGIGRKIYESLEKIAIKNKQKKIWLHSSPNAVVFYKKFGFKETGKDEFGSILMEKKLK